MQRAKSSAYFLTEFLVVIEKRLLADYIRYYHDDRTHLGLRKHTPGGRIRSAERA
jgi:hypothetical protein